MLRALVCCCWICRRGGGESDQRARHTRADSGSLQPQPIKRAAVLGPVKAEPFGWAAKTRPALTGPARDGCEIWRSGWKNARGAGRTEEWTRGEKGCEIDKTLAISISR